MTKRILNMRNACFYMLAENIIAKKVPGVSSLIKIGKFAVNKTMHSLEAAIENKVKSYIESNLENTIKRSERSLNEYFNKTQIVDMSEEIWESVAKTKLSEYFSAIDAKAASEFKVAAGKTPRYATSFCNKHDFWVTEL